MRCAQRLLCMGCMQSFCELKYNAGEGYVPWCTSVKIQNWMMSLLIMISRLHWILHHMCGTSCGKEYIKRPQWSYQQWQFRAFETAKCASNNREWQLYYIRLWNRESNCLIMKWYVCDLRSGAGAWALIDCPIYFKCKLGLYIMLAINSDNTSTEDCHCNPIVHKSAAKKALLV